MHSRVENDFLQCCCVIPIDDLCGKGEGSKVKNEHVPSFCTDVEVPIDLREAALGYCLAPGGKEKVYVCFSTSCAHKKYTYTVQMQLSFFFLIFSTSFCLMVHVL